MKTPLLCMTPLLNEPDEDLMVRGHYELLAGMLPHDYDKQLSDCIFVVGDNCAVNRLLATLMGVPLVRFASHRLNRETAVADEDTSKKASPSKGKLQPVVELANALQTGMEAIAVSMSAVPMGGGHLQQQATAILQQARAMAEQREETRQFQTMQLRL
ncbi:hypothetical protein JG687_00016744 [Phytophthora cactorum]|uniref:Uncharacterized protein n=2 Tax=Phytophthora cactorum TaxID=29920 RepID=A0A8T1TV31_9STRA|nr:hypothetical protein JG687_00016744 [Phytophthora cactorum]